jgi:hypothetical protein
MVGVPNQSDKASHSAATARSAPRLQLRGGSIGADEDLVPFSAACVTPQSGCDGEGAAALVKHERIANLALAGQSALRNLVPPNRSGWLVRV